MEHHTRRDDEVAMIIHGPKLKAPARPVAAASAEGLIDAVHEYHEDGILRSGE